MDTLSRLERTVAERRTADPSQSYVASLHAKGSLTIDAGAGRTNNASKNRQCLDDRLLVIIMVMDSLSAAMPADGTQSARCCLLRGIRPIAETCLAALLIAGLEPL